MAKSIRNSDVARGIRNSDVVRVWGCGDVHGLIDKVEIRGGGGGMFCVWGFDRW